MAAIWNFLSARKSQYLLSTLIGTYVPSFIRIPSSVLEKTFSKDWPIRNFKALWRQCLWRISTKETILVRELIWNITVSLVSCSVFLKKKLKVWKINKQTDDRHQVMAKAHTGHFPGELKWKQHRQIFSVRLFPIIFESEYVFLQDLEVRIFIFRTSVVRNPDKHNIYFIFSWRGQI